MNYSRSLGHFLESRSSFLKNVTADVSKWKGAKKELDIITSLRNGLERKSGQQPLPDNPCISLMLQCGMHLGHGTSRWNPNMAKYILGERAGIHIIDLEKTLACLRQASTVTAEIAQKGGRILFVGTAAGIQRLTYEAATHCKQYYVNQRWIGGTITNCKNVIGLDAKPHLVILLDLKSNLVAAKECFEANVPIMAICDTDCDPRLVTYPIPANDESLPSVELVAKSLALAANRGLARKQ